MEQYEFGIQRRVVAHKTSEAWLNTPHVSVLVEFDVTAVQAFIHRIAQHPDFRNIRVTLNSVMLKIIGNAMKHSPVMNAHITYNKRTSIGAMSVSQDVNIAVPLRSADGRMITPVLQQVNQKSLREVCEGMQDIKRRVANTNVDLLLLEAGLGDTWERLRKGQIITVLQRLYSNFIGSAKLSLPSREERRAYEKIPPQDRITAKDLLCATTLVSNIGSLMPELEAYFGLLEIIPPHTTAIGLAAARKKPVAVTDNQDMDRVDVREIMPASVCFDHRAMDYEHIVGFLGEVLRLCRAPEELLANGSPPPAGRFPRNCAK
ncbi:MAG TPA: 2-oxo acid dehydrogenase subunit E2 [Candidatus Hydrogenedentes bacterium]|nr:2-oxo acid dehydrogenase subunit E2 [Candidatus Hydrogenedentota bacterium]